VSGPKTNRAMITIFSPDGGTGNYGMTIQASKRYLTKTKTLLEELGSNMYRNYTIFTLILSPLGDNSFKLAAKKIF